MSSRQNFCYLLFTIVNNSSDLNRDLTEAPNEKCSVNKFVNAYVK